MDNSIKEPTVAVPMVEPVTSTPITEPDRGRPLWVAGLTPEEIIRWNEKCFKSHKEWQQAQRRLS